MPGRLAGGDTERVGGLRGVQSEELGAGGGGAEDTAGGCDVPAAGVMAGGDGIADPARDFRAQDEGVQHRGAGQAALLREGECGWGNRGGGMDDGPQVRVVVVEKVSGDCVDERCA